MQQPFIVVYSGAKCLRTYRWSGVALILEELQYDIGHDTEYSRFYRKGNIQIRLLKLEELDEEYVKLVSIMIGMPFDDFFKRYDELMG